MTSYQIPLLPSVAQTLQADIAGARYYLRLLYVDVPSDEGGWELDIANNAAIVLIGGIPLVTGVDLLAQYAYLGIGARLYIFTPGDVKSVPTYAGLGVKSFLLWEYAD